MKQYTITKSFMVEGIGLHSGKAVLLEFYPCPVNHGIVFERSDLSNSPRIFANAFSVNDTVMSSNLVKEDVQIGTVEHLLSAIMGLGIDNLLIRVSAAEIPIMDGSAYPFVNLFKKIGLVEQNALKKFLKITKPVRVEVADKWAELLPYDGYELNFEIDFDHPVFDKNQHCQFQFSTNDFISEVSQARTFGFLKDIEYLHQHNLALGGSMDNAIVLDDEKVLNESGLRYKNEFVRHKILDAIGDLFLIGYPLLAKFNAYKSGHSLNNQLVRTVLSDTTCFEIVTFYDQKYCPISY